MDNKTILITGAAKRIGASIARCLHAKGMDIVIHYNTANDEAQALLSELNSIRPDSSYLVCADLIKIDSTATLIKKAHSFNHRLDVLINNASVFYPSSIEKITEEEWDEIISINLKAPLFLAKHAAPYLALNNGCIINLADIHAERPLKNHPIYSISKSGLIMLTKALAKELAPAIRVNAISPGAILWPESMNEKIKKEILAKTVLNQPDNADDIVSAICYLINHANYMTGQVLTIDGGRTLFS